jgi:hypothetical protein
MKSTFQISNLHPWYSSVPAGLPGLAVVQSLCAEKGLHDPQKSFRIWKGLVPKLGSAREDINKINSTFAQSGGCF